MSFRDVVRRFDDFVTFSDEIKPCCCPPSRYKSPDFVLPVYKYLDAAGRHAGWLLECPNDTHHMKLPLDCKPVAEMCTSCFGLIRSSCECYSHKLTTERPKKAPLKGAKTI